MPWPLVLSLAFAIGCGDKDDGDDADGDGFDRPVDCDDGDATIDPTAGERCNDVDDDCDGDIDEDPVEGFAQYADADGDGWGDDVAGVACAVGPGMADRDGDCDDQDEAVSPEATEICNGGVDDDCDSLADDEDSSVVGGSVWYVDADGDGYGAEPLTACVRRDGISADSSDCDDANAAVHPGALDVCDGVDEDCDGAESGLVSIGSVLYGSIQAALDAAPTGATIEICDGVFQEVLTVERDVALVGRGGEESVVDADAEGAAMEVIGTGVDLTLEGLTLENGIGAPAPGSDPGGGALHAWRADSLVLVGCTIRNSEAALGGGILGPENGSVEIYDTIVSGNVATEGIGGGIALTAGPGNPIAIGGSQILDNHSGLDGGGVAIVPGEDGAGVAVILDTLVDGNSVDDDRVGGGLLSHATLALTAVTISNNAGGSGGGAFVLGDTAADEFTIVTGNIAVYGGGAYVRDASWSSGRFEGNAAEFGGGMFASGSTLSDVTIDANTATDVGGGLVAVNGVAVETSTLSNNTAVTGAGILVDADDPHHETTVDDCVITGNVASESGGGAVVYSRFESIHTDWGSDASDNVPDDVLFQFDPTDLGVFVVYEDIGAFADFVCDLETGTCE